MARVALALGVGLCLLVGAPARPAAGETLVVGVEGLDYEPIYWIDNGRYAGFARALLDRFARDAGLALAYRPLPVPRLYAEFFAGELDLKFPDDPRWRAADRAGRPIAHSRPVLNYVDGTMVPADRPADFQVRTLGMVAGFSARRWSERGAAGAVRLIANQGFTALVRQALAGRVDAIYANVALINHRLDRLFDRPGALVFDPALPYYPGVYRLGAYDRPDLIAAFDAWYDNNTGWIEALKTRYAVEEGIGDVVGGARGPAERLALFGPAVSR